eukprot:2326293-Pyramimonas_sp.AAC.1
MGLEGRPRNGALAAMGAGRLARGARALGRPRAWARRGLTRPSRRPGSSRHRACSACRAQPGSTRTSRSAS